MKKADYLNTLPIPAGLARDGEDIIEVQHFVEPAGKELVLSTTRTTAMGGQKPGTVSWPKPTTWRRLVSSKHGVWMTDWPVEQKQHHDLLRGVGGNVLVGGLGLALGATMLCRSPGVTSITIVETNPAVVALVGPVITEYAKSTGTVLHLITGDLHVHLGRCHAEHTTYDYGFYDIWQSDGEATFFDVVVPLWKWSQGVLGHPPICWNENVMRGQLMFSLLSRYQGPDLGMGTTWEQLATDTDDKWLRWSVPFFKWVVNTKPTDEDAHQAMQTYALLYGTWDWEDEWEDFCAQY